MYSVDQRLMQTEIGFILLGFEKLNKEMSRIEMDLEHKTYFLVVLDVIINMLNDHEGTLQDALEREQEKYPGDELIFALQDYIYEKAFEIRKHFVVNGFDRRIKYKIQERQLKRSTIKFYYIVMDLDATMEAYADKPVKAYEEDVISDNPSYEELEAANGQFIRS